MGCVVDLGRKGDLQGGLWRFEDIDARMGEMQGDVQTPPSDSLRTPFARCRRCRDREIWFIGLQQVQQQSNPNKQYLLSTPSCPIRRSVVFTTRIRQQQQYKSHGLQGLAQPHTNHIPELGRFSETVSRRLRRKSVLHPTALT